MIRKRVTETGDIFDFEEAVGDPSPPAPAGYSQPDSQVAGSGAPAGEDGGGVVPASETVSFSGSKLSFFNTYNAGITDAVQTAILAAEHQLQIEFTNSTPITIKASFGFGDVGGFLAQNHFGNVVDNVSYATLRTALINHATSADDQAATASLPGADPTGLHGYKIAGGLARLLGIPGNSSAQNDLDLVLGNTINWTFDPFHRSVAGAYDAIAAIQHELTEGGFGRVAGLGDQNSAWSILDLFRYSSAGVRETQDGRAGGNAFFSVDGVNMLTQFHQAAANGTFDGADPGDWEHNVVGDSFGDGNTGVPGIVTVPDLRELDVIGWTRNTSFISARVNDYNVDGTSDLLLRDNTTGAVTYWGISNGSFQTSVQIGGVGGNIQVAGHGDFNHDGDCDVLLRDVATGNLTEWFVQAGLFAGAAQIGNMGDTQIAGVGDFNKDGNADVLLRDPNGALTVWTIINGQFAGSTQIGGVGSKIQVAGVGDFSGDGNSDVLLRDTQSGAVTYWQINSNTTFNSSHAVGGIGGNIQIVGAGDFNGGGSSDILLRDLTTGAVSAWELSNGAFFASHQFGGVGSNIQVASILDLDGDGTSDIVLRDMTTGGVSSWHISNYAFVQSAPLGGIGSNISIIK